VFREPTRIPARAETIIDPPEAFQQTPPSSGAGIGVIGGLPATGGGGGDLNINRFIPQPQPPAAPAPPAVKPREQPVVQVPVGGKVQEAKLTHKSMPIYPQIARTARVSGVVRLSAIIGTEGAIRELKIVSGHPLLVAAAVDAVRQWRYRPTLLNNQPVEVITTIDVHFTLN
jgi:protein TonB